jgi:predicted RNA-binding Zn-ribbon protein involved in translation (DUF1610 family)
MVAEWCPNCEQEVELEEVLTPQLCPNCSVVILPCALCGDYDNCNNCKLENMKKKYSND